MSTSDEVGIQPPSQRLIEVLGSIDIGDGQHHYLEFHVLTVYAIATHPDLL
ncbi:MAG TPA: hypothetical protein V6C78_19285 [Crinalium sp.]